MQTNFRGREAAKRVVGEVFASPDNVYAIHYSAQRLRRDQTELAPPVAAIALRNVGTGQGRVFSIRAEADITGIDLSGRVSEATMQRLEYNVLFNYNEFLNQNRHAYFAHWYMRDEKFGFAALEHRCRKVMADLNQALLGPRAVGVAAAFGFGRGPSPFPIRIDETHKVDLARIISLLYGVDFVGLKELADRNGLSRNDMIEGRNEPEVFESGNHARLQWSTSAKARLIAEILQRIHSGRLVAQADRPRPSSNGRIFINYRREDTEAAAGRLHDHLSAAFGGDNVFIDTDDIPAGVDYVEHLREQIEACDVFLAVIGRRWAQLTDASGIARLMDPRDLVRREIRSALSRGIPVIPVLVDGAQLPREDQLPVDLVPFRRRNFVEVRNSQFANDTERLAGKVRETIAHARSQIRQSM